MSPDPAKTIFLSALEVEMGPQRDAFVRQACGKDDALLEKVRKLLAHEVQANSFLEAPIAGAAVSQLGVAAIDYRGRKLGPYKVRERIGEGGMGIVYVAEQEKPIRRKVALKVIKPGMDSGAILGRFEAERNALALMNHPNIAKVLDAGTTDEGTPYFVMELVSGIPITEYCDRESLAIAQRLDLFVDVCNAIQHAHQKGIIHRDVKPSNVLITELDGQSIVKVIDFGLAKALNQSLTEHSIYTAFQAVIGTPLYMSPEQASFSAVDVDTRSDVYSLGVLLYELLTGTTPLAHEELKRAAQDEVLRLIREQDPPRPSNRISTLGDGAAQLSQRRCSHPEQLSRSVKGDLDWIVMKALSKERGRRYDSANRFAEDVQRYLQHDVVEARPPSLTYRVAKFTYRNRSLVTTAVAILLAASIAFGGILWGYLNTHRRHQQVQALANRLQGTLEQLGDVLAERALDDVFSGNADSAKLAIEQAEQAQAPRYITETLRGIAQLFANDVDSAMATLKRVIEDNPTYTPAKSVLAWVYHITNQPGNHATMKSLAYADIAAGGQEHDSDLDRFFLLLGSFVNGDEAALRSRLTTLQELTRRHPNWGAASVLSARVRAQLGKITHDPDEFERALVDVELARERIGECPMYLDTKLTLLVRMIDLYRSRGLDSERLELEARASIASARRPGIPIAPNEVAAFEYFYGDREAAERILANTIAAAPHGTLVHAATQFALDKRKAPLDQWRASSQHEAKLCLAFTLAASGPTETELEEIHGIIDELISTSAPVFLALALDVPCVLGDRQLFDKILSHLEESTEVQDGTYFLSLIIGHYTGTLPAEDWIRYAAPYSHERCTAHYVIGMKCLLDRRLADARKHFATAAGSFRIGHWGFFCGQLYTQRLDAGWLGAANEEGG